MHAIVENPWQIVAVDDAPDQCLLGVEVGIVYGHRHAGMLVGELYWLIRSRSHRVADHVNLEF